MLNESGVGTVLDFLSVLHLIQIIILAIDN